MHHGKLYWVSLTLLITSKGSGVRSRGVSNKYHSLHNFVIKIGGKSQKEIFSASRHNWGSDDIRYHLRTGSTVAGYQ